MIKMKKEESSEDLDETEVGSNQSTKDWSIQTSSGIIHHYHSSTPRVRYELC
jgi:hypothetical protein